MFGANSSPMSLWQPRVTLPFLAAAAVISSPWARSQAVSAASTETSAAPAEKSASGALATNVKEIQESSPGLESGAAGTLGSPDQLQQIVVTANRRAQNIQDVGAAITGESGYQITALNITRGEDLVKMAPGISAIPSNGSATSAYAIRGVSQADSSEDEEQPVAIYQDGVYIPNAAATGFPVYDVNHVEILRGPQGTLFGRNATGGLVESFSNTPQPGLSGALEYSAGDYNLHGGQGHINFGDETVSDRFAFYASQRDGYVKNLDGPDLWAEQVVAFRNQTEFHFSDTTQALLRLETWQTNGTPANRQTASFTPAGSIYDQALPDNAPNLYGYVNPSSSPYIEAVNEPGEIFKRPTTAALTVQHEAGDIMFEYSTSFQHVRVHYLEDTDGTPNNAAVYYDGANADTIEAEFRALKSSGRFTWTSGVNFFENRGTYFTYFAVPTLCDPTSTTVCATAGGGSAHLPLNPNTGRGATVTTAYGLNFKTYSAFAQGQYDFTRKLKGILGGRVQYDDERYNYHFNCAETLTQACETIFAVPAGSSGGFNYPDSLLLSQKHTLWSGKAELDYRLTPGVLIYGLFSKGTKSGGFFSATAGGIPPSQLSFAPEELFDTEVGIKTTLLNERLTVDADYYHYDYHDSQQFNFVEGIFFTVVNLPATANGVELEAHYLIVPGWRFNVSGAYADMWVHNVQPCPTCTPMKERPDDAPVWTGTAGFERDFELRHVLFSLNYNARYTGDRFYALVNQPIIHAGGYVVQDASLRATLPDALWVQAWVNNISNKEYESAKFDNTAQGFMLRHIAAPRMVGITVGMEF